MSTARRQRTACLQGESEGGIAHDDALAAIGLLIALAEVQGHDADSDDDEAGGTEGQPCQRGTFTRGYAE